MKLDLNFSLDNIGKQAKQQKPVIKEVKKDIADENFSVVDLITELNIERSTDRPNEPQNPEQIAARFSGLFTEFQQKIQTHPEQPGSYFVGDPKEIGKMVIRLFLFMRENPQHFMQHPVNDKDFALLILGARESYAKFKRAKTEKKTAKTERQETRNSLLASMQKLQQKRT